MRKDFLSELREMWRKYRGDRLFVRYRFGQYNFFTFGKIISVPDTGDRVEVMPMAGTRHKKTEWVETDNMYWWKAQNKKIHPDWPEELGTPKDVVEELEETSYFIANESGWLWHAGSQFKPSFLDAIEYGSVDAADRIHKKITPTFQNTVRIIGRPEALAIATEHEWPTELEEEKIEEIVAAPVPESTPEEEEVKILDTEALKGKFRDMYDAWNMYTEAGSRFMEEIMKLLE